MFLMFSLGIVFFRIMPTFLALERKTQARGNGPPELSYNDRACGFLLFLFIICPGKADNCLAVMSAVINLADDNSRKTCAVCKAGGTAFPPRINHIDLHFAFFVMHACFVMHA